MSKVRQLDRVIDLSDTCMSGVLDKAHDVSSDWEVIHYLVKAKAEKDSVGHSTVTREEVATPNVGRLVIGISHMLSRSFGIRGRCVWLRRKTKL